MRKKEIRPPASQRASLSGFSQHTDSVARGPWAIDWIPHTAGAPGVDLKARKARLWDPAVSAIEAHEGWHIAYTPEKGAQEWADEISAATGVRCDATDVNACEDGRINRIGLRALQVLSPSKHAEVYAALGEVQGIDVLKPRILAAEKAGNMRQAARLIMAGLPHTEPLLWKDAWKRKKPMQEMVTELRRYVRYAGIDVERLPKVVSHIAGLASEALLPPPKPKEKPKPEWVRPDVTGDRVDRADYVVPGEMPKGDYDGTPWGAMTIHQPKLTETVYDGTDALTRPTAEPGTLPKFMHRWRPWEGSFDVFARKRRDQGKKARLSLLIDGSGSMDVTNQIIAEIQERLPAATVGIYASETDHCRAGTLVVVAQGGKRLVFADRIELAMKHNLGDGNVVDGPALRWLGKLAGPRVWVSDGRVTGVGDRSSDSLQREAKAIVRACGIEQCCDGEALFAWLDAHGFKKSAVKRLR